MTSPDTLARRISRHLPRQPDITPAVSRRLTAIRYAALKQQKMPVIKTGHGTLGLLITGWKRQSLAAAFLLLSSLTYFAYEADQHVKATVEQDVQILSDELPLDALLDPDFFDFMKGQSADLEEGLQ